MGSNLQGKVTIVTGAASGIGRGAAMVFAANGARSWSRTSMRTEE